MSTTISVNKVVHFVINRRRYRSHLSIHCILCRAKVIYLSVTSNIGATETKGGYLLLIITLNNKIMKSERHVHFHKNYFLILYFFSNSFSHFHKNVSIFISSSNKPYSPLHPIPVFFSEQNTPLDTFKNRLQNNTPI